MDTIQELKKRIDQLEAALGFIANNPPETPAEYSVMRDIARRALDYGHGD